MIIFISYARVDIHLVAPLSDFLKESGHEPWFDHLLLPGQVWKQVLADQIEACDVFLYALSQYSTESQWCQWEYGVAIQNNKPVLPVLLNSETEVPAELGELHCVPVSKHERILGGLAHLSAGGAGSRASLSLPVNPLGEPSRAAYRKQRRINTPHSHLERLETEPQRRPQPSECADPKNQKIPIISIDFGTTNSLCAVKRGETLEVIPNRYGDRSTPSAVYIQSDGSVITGTPAAPAILRDPQHGVLQVKRLFGTSSRLKAYGREYTPAQLAGFILKELRTDCESFLGHDCSRVLITAPAYYTEAELDDLREACRLAGIDVVRIIAEPTAASLAYAQHVKDGVESVAVFDLGGGTFDITILIADGGDDLLFEIRAVNGDTSLGGTDYDQALVEFCIQRFRDQTGIDLSGNTTAEMRIREAAERTKIELTSHKSATVHVPFIFSNASGSLDLVIPITRVDFNNITGHLAARIVECCKEALSAARLHLTETPGVDRLLLVALATRTPMIRDKAEELFGVRASMTLDPDSAVAQGGAVQAAIIQGSEKRVTLLDLVPHDIAVELADGDIAVMIQRNRIIPRDESEDLRTTCDQQTSTVLKIIQGNNADKSMSSCLSRIAFDGIEPAAAGISELKLNVDVDVNSQMTVTIEDVTSHRSRSVNITREPVYEDAPVDGVSGELKLSADERSSD